MQSNSIVNKRRQFQSLTAAAVLIGLIPAASASEENQSVLRGKADFQTHCASCHGSDGTGTGPASEVFISKPTDLTQLAANNNGEFPREHVFRIIDGRAELKAHGSRTMPVWGFRFGGMSRDEQDADVRRRINNIIAYLETLQK